MNTLKPKRFFVLKILNSIFYKASFFLIFVLFLICLLPKSVIGQTAELYVAENGSDSNPGTSDRPFRTLSKSASVATPGTRINIRNGTYEKNFNIAGLRGSDSSPIVISGESVDGVIFDAENSARNTTAFNFERISNVRIENITFRNSGGKGLKLSGPNCHNVTLSNTNIHNHWHYGLGIVNCQNLTVRDSRIHNNVQMCASGVVGNSECSPGDAVGPSGGWPPGFIVFGGSSHIYIINNKIYENEAEGIAFNQGNTNAYIYGNVAYDNRTVQIYLDGTGNSVIEGNLVYRGRKGGAGISVAYEGQNKSDHNEENILIRNNFVFNFAKGISIFDYTGDLRMEGSVIENNTVVNTATSIDGGASLRYRGSKGLNKVSFKNNIVVDDRVSIVDFANLGDVAFSNNLFFTNRGEGSNSFKIGGSSMNFNDFSSRLGGRGSNNIFANPQFVGGIGGSFNPSDYKLAAGSPAINAGIAMHGNYDKDFYRFTRTLPVDLGALEYASVPTGDIASIPGLPAAVTTPFTVPAFGAPFALPASSTPFSIVGTEPPTPSWLVLDQSVDEYSPNRGQVFKYTISAQNNLEQGLSVVLESNLDGKLKPYNVTVERGGSCSILDQKITCILSINRQSDLKVTIQAYIRTDVNPGTSISNVVTAREIYGRTATSNPITITAGSGSQDPPPDPLRIIPVDIFCSDGVGIFTAIGCIPLLVGGTLGMVAFFLIVGGGIAGGITLILILYGGYMIMTSVGDPHKLQAGKELISSAIFGLIMVIFSILILRLIASDVLRIF